MGSDLDAPLDQMKSNLEKIHDPREEDKAKASQAIIAAEKEVSVVIPK